MKTISLLILLALSSLYLKADTVFDPVYDYGKGHHIILSDFKFSLGSSYKNTGILAEASKRISRATEIGLIAGYNRTTNESGQYEFTTNTTVLGLKLGTLLKSPVRGFQSKLTGRAYCSIVRPDNTVRFANDSVTVSNNGHTLYFFNINYFMYKPFRVLKSLKICPGIGIDTYYKHSSDDTIHNNRDFKARLFLKIPLIFRVTEGCSIIAEPVIYMNDQVSFRAGVIF